MLTLRNDDYGKVEAWKEENKLKVRYKLSQAVRFGYSAYSADVSNETRYEPLPAGDGETEFAFPMPSRVSAGSAVFLRCVMRTADGKSQLAIQEENVQRAQQAADRDAAMQAHLDAWEPPPGATANHV